LSIAEQVSIAECPTDNTTEMTRIVAASVIGTAIEWYDFIIYGTASALVFNKLFFPLSDPALGTIAAFGAYAVGYFARPLGRIIIWKVGALIETANSATGGCGRAAARELRDDR
jgi:MHS family shikimate/dehydroshikimate transporter-like MFS transporter